MSGLDLPLPFLTSDFGLLFFSSPSPAADFLDFVVVVRLDDDGPGLGRLAKLDGDEGDDGEEGRSVRSRTRGRRCVESVKLRSSNMKAGAERDLPSSCVFPVSTVVLLFESTTTSRVSLD